MATPTALAGYLALFVLVGLLFVLVSLLAGRLLRPSSPNKEKREIYECGEPAIGSGFLQFDLRFYVVALVFIVFDVEVAFLFPLATVYGKATNLKAEIARATADENLKAEIARATADEGVELMADARALVRELGVDDSTAVAATGKTSVAAAAADTAGRLAAAAFVAINLFFGVLLLGFAYEWRTGAFDWVRAVTRERWPGRQDVAGQITLERGLPRLTA